MCVCAILLYLLVGGTFLFVLVFGVSRLIADLYIFVSATVTPRVKALIKSPIKRPHRVKGTCSHNHFSVTFSVGFNFVKSASP